MIKDLAWNAFKNTGNINTFLELKQIEELQNMRNNIYSQKVETNGDNKDQGYNNF